MAPPNSEANSPGTFWFSHSRVCFILCAKLAVSSALASGQAQVSEQLQRCKEKNPLQGGPRDAQHPHQDPPHGQRAQSSWAGWEEQFWPLSWDLRWHQQSQQGLSSTPQCQQSSHLWPAPPRTTAPLSWETESWTPSFSLSSSKSLHHPWPAVRHAWTMVLLQEMVNWWHPVAPEQSEQLCSPAQHQPLLLLWRESQWAGGAAEAHPSVASGVRCLCIAGHCGGGWTALLREALWKQVWSPAPCSACSRAGPSLQTGDTGMGTEPHTKAGPKGESRIGPAEAQSGVSNNSQHSTSVPMGPLRRHTFLPVNKMSRNAWLSKH